MSEKAYIEESSALLKQGEFERYIQHSQDHLKSIRKDQQYPHDQKSIDHNSPYCLIPENFDHQRAILMIHGFIASPYAMRAVSDHYLKKGYMVLAIVLPGHGSTPKQLLECDNKDWLKVCKSALEGLKKHAEKIAIGGYSLGGALAFLTAHKQSIDHLFLMVPCLALAPAHSVAQVFGHIVPKWPLKRICLQPPPQMEHHPVQYEQFPMAAVVSVLNAVSAFKKLPTSSWENTCIKMIATHEDITVLADKSLEFFKKNQHPKSYLRFYSAKPLHFDDTRIAVIDSRKLGNNIQSMSHIAVPFTTQDPIYGSSSFHAGYGETNWQLGEFLPDEKKQRARLTYNPDFKAMMEACLS